MTEIDEDGITKGDWDEFLEEHPIDFESDGEEDHFDELGVATLEREEELKGRRLASSWGERFKGKESPRDTIIELIKIRNAVHNLVKIHGVPQGTRLELASLGQLGSGMAATSPGQAPVILLDKGIYDTANPHEILDIYCGVGLHEASHLNHSQEMFARLRSGELIQGSERAMWEGLFEDERIEEFVREESPGFAPYLHAAKRHIFDNQEAGKAHKIWNELPDLDKICLIIFDVIRCPHRITEEMKAFNDINGENVLAALRRAFPKTPRTPKDVETAGMKLMLLWNSWKELYKKEVEKSEGGKGEGEDDKTAEGPHDKSDDPGTCHSTGSDSPHGSPSKSEGSGDADEAEETEGETPEPELTPEERDRADRIEKQKKALADDKGLKDLAETLEQAKRDIAKKAASFKSAEDFGKKMKDDPENTEKELKAIEGDLAKIEDAIDDLSKIREGRFSVEDLMRMMERASKIEDPLSGSESKEMAKVEDERLEIGEDWDVPGKESDEGPPSEPGDKPDAKKKKARIGREGTGSRKTLVIHPKPEGRAKSTYKALHENVKDHVARMRSVFALRLGQRTHTETELVEGRLHKRRISQAMSTNRIFKNSYTTVAKGIALCLVLDESGSMGHIYGTPDADPKEWSSIETAAHVAVLIAESLKGQPGIELEVYAYSSCGSGDRDCLVKYLYGKKNKDLASIGGYRGGAQNYDHISLKKAGEMFIQNTKNENRMMIVLNDGAPCGHGYGGPSAVRATKKSVDDLRKKGIHVLNVAIQAFDSKSMFGDHVLKFLDLPNLINDMRRLITNLVKKTVS